MAKRTSSLRCGTLSFTPRPPAASGGRAPNIAALREHSVYLSAQECPLEARLRRRPGRRDAIQRPLRDVVDQELGDAETRADRVRDGGCPTHRMRGLPLP